MNKSLFAKACSGARKVNSLCNIYATVLEMSDRQDIVRSIIKSVKKLDSETVQLLEHVLAHHKPCDKNGLLTYLQHYFPRNLDHFDAEASAVWVHDINRYVREVTDSLMLTLKPHIPSLLAHQVLSNLRHYYPDPSSLTIDMERRLVMVTTALVGHFDEAWRLDTDLLDSHPLRNAFIVSKPVIDLFVDSDEATQRVITLFDTENIFFANQLVARFHGSPVPLLEGIL